MFKWRTFCWNYSFNRSSGLENVTINDGLRINRRLGFLEISNLFFTVGWNITTQANFCTTYLQIYHSVSKKSDMSSLNKRIDYSNVVLFWGQLSSSLFMLFNQTCPLCQLRAIDFHSKTIPSNVACIFIISTLHICSKQRCNNIGSNYPRGISIWVEINAPPIWILKKSAINRIELALSIRGILL